MSNDSPVIIDVSPLVYRAWGKEGGPTGQATLARTSARLYQMVAGLQSWPVQSPTHGAAVLEGRGASWRARVYPLYKANRGPKDPLVVQLLHVAEELFQALGWLLVRVDGYEADDVVCSLVHRERDAVVVSSDKDFYQFWGVLGCRIWDPTMTRKGDRPDQWPGRWVEAQDLYRRFGSPDPARVVEVQALMGDATDNIPGAHGVGEITAMDLIDKWGSVAGVYAALDAGRISGAVAKRLAASREDVELSRRMVRLEPSLRVSAGPVRAPDEARLAELMRQYGWGAELAEVAHA